MDMMLEQKEEERRRFIYSKRYMPCQAWKGLKEH
jgi:hypothetical protein